jgi:hypothetical protein
MAGTRPEGVLVYQDWVTDGQQRTNEADTVPADLVAVPWRHDDRLQFEIGVGQLPAWANVLVHDELPADHVPDDDPDRIECPPSAEASQCTVDQSSDDLMIMITAHPSEPGEIIVLNVGWELPERYRDHDPLLPAYVSASWVFATEVADP